MSNATYNVVEPVASDWLETRDSAQDLLPINPCCLFTHKDAYNKSIPSKKASLCQERLAPKNILWRVLRDSNPQMACTIISFQD